MKFDKLTYRESVWPDLGKTITIDFAMNEIIVDSFVEGVKWCRIGSRERSTIEAKLNTSRPEEWSENYYEPVLDGMNWDLKLFEGSDLVKESSGSNGYPPNEQWQALCSLVTFCSIVTRRYGEAKGAAK
ncbi:MAG: hypothetical protein IKX19_03965 [Clostridia bacterium]|nr:hypothetical protein [Clostridia bacterium]